jgi:hypothetical protein
MICIMESHTGCATNRSQPHQSFDQEARVIPGRMSATRCRWSLSRSQGINPHGQLPGRFLTRPRQGLENRPIQTES